MYNLNNIVRFKMHLLFSIAFIFNSITSSQGSRVVSIDSAQEGQNEKENIVAKMSTKIIDKKDYVGDTDLKPGKWRRKGRRNRRAVATANYLASIREQFAEVRIFIL